MVSFRKTMFAAVSVATALSIPALAQAGGLEKKSITIAVAGSIGQMNKVPLCPRLEQKVLRAGRPDR